MARIEIEIPGTVAMQEKLAAKPRILRRGVVKALRLSGESVYARALENVSGKILKVRTGTLRRRLGYSVDPETLEMQVGSPVVYARIHEYGGTIQHPGGTAYYFNKRTGLAVFISNKKASMRRAWVGGELTRWHQAGDLGFPRTKPHAIPIPARPFLRPALRDSIPAIKQHFTEQLGESLKEAQ